MSGVKPYKTTENYEYYSLQHRLQTELFTGITTSTTTQIVDAKKLVQKLILQVAHSLVTAQKIDPYLQARL